jgi:hypothetical protein
MLCPIALSGKAYRVTDLKKSTFHRTSIAHTPNSLTKFNSLPKKYVNIGVFFSVLAHNQQELAAALIYRRGEVNLSIALHISPHRFQESVASNNEVWCRT